MVDKGISFDAIAVFRLNQKQLFRVARAKDGFIFAYIGASEEYRKFEPAVLERGLLGFFFGQLARRWRQRLDREASEMMDRIANTAESGLLHLHPLNFRIYDYELDESRIVGSVFWAGYGTFWRFRTKSNAERIFRIVGSEPEKQAAAQQISAAVPETPIEAPMFSKAPRPHAIHFLLHWPIVWLLAVTSFPAGLTPCVAYQAYRDIRQEQRLAPKWVNQRRIESNEREMHIAITVFAITFSIHSSLAWFFWRHRKNFYMGIRGDAWHLLLWCGLATGVAIGICFS
jgi:hypothetical protein